MHATFLEWSRMVPCFRERIRGWAIFEEPRREIGLEPSITKCVRMLTRDCTDPHPSSSTRTRTALTSAIILYSLFVSAVKTIYPRQLKRLSDIWHRMWNHRSGYGDCCLLGCGTMWIAAEALYLTSWESLRIIETEGNLHPTLPVEVQNLYFAC
jgi:hypothetical protein